jgi:hypothetical protein
VAVRSGSYTGTERRGLTQFLEELYLKLSSQSETVQGQLICDILVLLGCYAVFDWQLKTFRHNLPVSC